MTRFPKTRQVDSLTNNFYLQYVKGSQFIGYVSSCWSHLAHNHQSAWWSSVKYHVHNKQQNAMNRFSLLWGLTSPQRVDLISLIDTPIDWISRVIISLIHILFASSFIRCLFCFSCIFRFHLNAHGTHFAVSWINCESWCYSSAAREIDWKVRFISEKVEHWIVLSRLVDCIDSTCQTFTWFQLRRRRWLISPGRWNIRV